MDDTINYLSSHGIAMLKEGETLQANATSTTGVKYGMLWLDIEGTSVSAFV